MNKKVTKKPSKSISKVPVKKEGLDLDFADGEMEEILDEMFLGDFFWGCLVDNDPKAAMEVLKEYCELHDKEKLYHSLQEKNPTLETLAKLVSSICTKSK